MHSYGCDDNGNSTGVSGKKVTLSATLAFPLASGQPPVSVPFDFEVAYSQKDDPDSTFDGPVVDKELLTGALTDVKVAVIHVIQGADDATVKLNDGVPLPLVGYNPPTPAFAPRPPQGFSPGILLYCNPLGGLTSIKFNSASQMRVKAYLFG